jgi:hypothetical protein
MTTKYKPSVTLTRERLAEILSEFHAANGLPKNPAYTTTKVWSLMQRIVAKKAVAKKPAIKKAAPRVRKVA